MSVKEKIKAYIEEPIKKKWVYNFLVSPRTNLIDKPEWYLSQTLKKIYDNIDDIETKIRVRSSDDVNVKHQFIMCMLELAMLRLNKDMKTISKSINDNTSGNKSEEILIHTYNEVIQFTKVIRQLLGNSFVDIPDQYDMLSVFSNQQLFEKIVDVEWNCAEKNLEEIVSSPTKWDLVLKDEFEDEYKISKCLDSFIMLTISITERIECFQQLDCQFKLIELQCHLINKFLRFLRSSAAPEPKSTGIGMISNILFFGDDSTIELTRILRVLNGVDFLRFILGRRYFIPKHVLEKLDPSLAERANRITKDYKNLYNNLIEKVVGIYATENVDCDLREYLLFIEPKLAGTIYKTIRDETKRVYEKKQTQKLLGLDSHLLVENE